MRRLDLYVGFHLSITKYYIDTSDVKYGQVIIRKSLSLGCVVPLIHLWGKSPKSKNPSASLDANLWDGCFSGEATDGITDTSYTF